MYKHDTDQSVERHLDVTTPLSGNQINFERCTDWRAVMNLIQGNWPGTHRDYDLILSSGDVYSLKVQLNYFNRNEGTAIVNFISYQLQRIVTIYDGLESITFHGMIKYKRRLPNHDL